MEAKEGIKTNIYGQAILSSEQLRDLVLQGRNINRFNVVRDQDIENFDKYQSSLIEENIEFLEMSEETLSFDDFHRKSADQWIFPEVYQHIDVRSWLLKKCKTDVERNRVEEEYQMYEERELIMLLRLFIYLVEYMRKNKHVWGVGRGSSVSSYILYLIGIHKVDSIKYNLDIREYLK